MQSSFLVVCDGPGNEQIRQRQRTSAGRAFRRRQIFLQRKTANSALEALLCRGWYTLIFHEKLGSMRDKSKRLETVGYASSGFIGIQAN